MRDHNLPRFLVSLFSLLSKARRYRALVLLIKIGQPATEPIALWFHEREINPWRLRGPWWWRRRRQRRSKEEKKWAFYSRHYDEPPTNLILYWFTSNRLVRHFVPRRYFRDEALSPAKICHQKYTALMHELRPPQSHSRHRNICLVMQTEVLDFVRVVFVSHVIEESDLTDKRRYFLTGSQWSSDVIRKSVWIR